MAPNQEGAHNAALVLGNGEQEKLNGLQGAERGPGKAEQGVARAAHDQQDAPGQQQRVGQDSEVEAERSKQTEGGHLRTRAHELPRLHVGRPDLGVGQTKEQDGQAERFDIQRKSDSQNHAYQKGPWAYAGVRVSVAPRVGQGRGD